MSNLSIVQNLYEHFQNRISNYGDPEIEVRSIYLGWLFKVQTFGLVIRSFSTVNMSEI